jgi:cobalt/nickel transport system ATP-binding protein
MHHNPISISQLSYSYPDGTKALLKLDLEIKATEKVALVGANGSGKSTLLLHLNGVLLPQKGEIVVGENIVNHKNLQGIRNFIGLVFQNPDDQLFMPTVWQDVAFGPMNQGFRGQALSDRITKAMNSVGLDIEQYRNRQAHNLSGGEKKRVAIAGVLAMEPQVLAFDEPTAQLDPRSRRQLIQLLKSLPQTQLIATHDLDLALEISDRTVILNQGQIVYDGDTKTALSDSELLEKYSLELPLCLSRSFLSN